MAVRNSVTREGDHSGHTTRRNGGDEGVGGSTAEDGEDRAAGQTEEDPGERWFRQENTEAEIRTLARLEDDLNSALLSEHGVDSRASQLWITRILPGKLSPEHKALGKAVEVFAKIQQRDIMRSMVKLHDLVDLVEPPWRNLAEASTSGRSWDEPMDLDAEVADRDEDVVDPPNNSGEPNLGLG